MVVSRLSFVIFVLAAVQTASAQFVLQDKAIETGTDAPSFGRGAAMVDLDGDGLLDLVAANDTMISHFYKQLPDHTFIDARAIWGIPASEGEDKSWGVLAADFDNDGDDDLYLLCLGYPTHPNRLLRNDIATTGGFTDVTSISGDAVMLPRTFSGTALDYNNDGLLDIFLSSPRPAAHNHLLRNDGQLVFTDVSVAAGFVEPDALFKHCSAGDYNNDGCIDIGVGTFLGDNRLYRNNCDGTFTDVALQAGVQGSGDQDFGLVFEDFDNDGWMDLWAPKYYYQAALPGQTTKIFRNNRDGTFTDVSITAGLTGQSDMGHSSNDINGDGYPDIFIGTGHPSFLDFDVLWLIRPDGLGGFSAEDVSVSSGISANGETRCHGMAFGDYDQDGRIDVYVSNGGPPTDRGGETGVERQIQENFLWNGSANTYNWIGLELTGTVSNRTGVGARLVATTNTGREVHRMLRVGHGFANTDSHIQHFGLGTDTSVERIVINWPSGIRQTLFNPPINQVSEVIEQLADDDCGRVPNGWDAAGVPLKLTRAGNDIRLTWSASCAPSDTDFAVYEGALGLFPSQAPATCSTDGLTTTTLTPSAGNSYYLVVPRNLSWEGSHGTDSQGNERSPGLVPACLDQRLGCR